MSWCLAPLKKSDAKSDAAPARNSQHGEAGILRTPANMEFSSGKVGGEGLEPPTLSV
jgi:hypothetical protein